MTTFTTEDRIIAEKDGSFTINVEGSVTSSPPHIVDSGASVMNNKPVAWIDPKELDMDVSTSVTKNRQFESDIPLYVKPQKYCPSENNEAYEKGFIDGMAKQRDSKVQQMVEGYTHPVKELTDEEIGQIWKDCMESPYMQASNPVGFARAILRKAQGK
jgi:hypothetical protein